MVICEKCRTRSDVKESRSYDLNGIATKLRIRQCRKCRWRWKTVELNLEIKEPAPNANL